jgi:bifunctional DNase/RNase
MSSETFVEADVWTIAQTEQGNVVLIRPRGSDLAVPIIIGQLETQSILIGMGGVEVPRPLTHDLAISILKALSTFLVRIEINDLQEGTFYARLVLRQGAEEILVDARPSDAIGMAVRTGCPVFISEAVVDEAGISVSLVTEAAGSATLSADGEAEGELDASEDSAFEDDTALPAEPAPPDSLSTILREELEEAIFLEDYERAAELRDRLRDLGAAI